VEDLEALVLDSLVAESADVFSDEFEVALVDVHRVGEVILLHVLLRIADELADSFNARGTLVVLELDVVVQDLDELVRAADSHGLEDADQAHLEALKVPVLVDDGVDNVGSENLLGFLSQKEAEVVHHVDSLVVVLVLHDVLRE
jgi:hypothetical protein